MVSEIAFTGDWPIGALVLCDQSVYLLTDGVMEDSVRQKCLYECPLPPPGLQIAKPQYQALFAFLHYCAPLKIPGCLNLQQTRPVVVTTCGSALNDWRTTLIMGNCLDFQILHF